MTTNSKPSQIIKIDKHTNKIALPTILLQTRSFNTIGKLNYTNFNVSLVANGIDEISFEVHKYVDGRICPIWDSIEDLKLVEVEDYGRFQIKVSYTDNTETIKAIHGQSLEVELGQIYLNNFHVNDEEATDMVYSDYSKDNYDLIGDPDEKNYVYVPTTFYRDKNSASYSDKDPKRSLLDRVLADKGSHWKIGHVPTYVSMSEDDEAELASTFQRIYTVDGTSIYDFLTGDVVKETNVIFVFNTFERVIDCYSLIDCYKTNPDGTRTLVEHAYGDDTNILVSKKNLASEISIESNQEELKNCFRVEGGDDLITASVAAVNMNGTNYIWCFSDLQFRDMSEELRSKIEEYQGIMSDPETKEIYYGENGIYTRLCNAYEELYQKESSLMPCLTTVDSGDAKTQYEKVVSALESSTVYVTSVGNYTAGAHTGLDRMVIEYASIFMDSRFKIEVVNDKESNISQFDEDAKKWKGKIKITQKTNSSNTYPTIVDNFQRIEVKIDDKYSSNGKIDPSGELEFVRQKTLKALAESDMQNFDFTSINEDKARSYFEQFALNRLTSFYDAYERCLSIMGDFGVVQDKTDERRKLYDEYYKILSVIGEVKKVREQEVQAIKDKIGVIEGEQIKFQNDEKYNFEKFLGEELYKEFCLYRREDTYSNSNYTSDNLNTTADLLNKAQELLKVAETELKKACVLQRTVSASLGNLLALPEFEPLYEQFSLYNFIRIRTEDEIIKLRLIKIEFDGDSIDGVNVTFSEQIESVDKRLSDMESVLQQASSIATSYSSTVKQAKQGANANNQYVDMVTNGLVAAKTSLATDIHNEVEITGAGIIARRMDDEGFYGDKQMKISGNRLYFTNNAWKSVAMAIGEILFNGEEKYGIIAECIVGKMIAGENMTISNENGTVEITGDGIVIYDNKKNKVFFADADGNLTLTGNINATGGKIGGLFISDKSLSVKYGFNYKRLPIDPDNNMRYIDCDYFYDTGLAKLRCYYNIDLKAFYIKILSNVGTGNNPQVIDFETERIRYLYCYGDESPYTLDIWTIEDNKLYFDIDGNVFMYGRNKKYGDNLFSKYYLYNDSIEYMGYTGTNTHVFKERYKMIDDIEDWRIDYGEVPYTADVDLYIESDFDAYKINMFNYNDIINQILSDSTVNNTVSTDNTIYIGERGLSIGRSLKYSSANDTLSINGISSSFYPLEDNKYDNGVQMIRWRNIYASTSVISTSDKNKKQNISYDLDEYVTLFDKLKPCSFEFIDGTSGRTHIGYIAQDVEDALNELGISSTKFGGFCKSSINGVEIYSLRYDEFQGLYDAKIKQLEKRLEKLENYILKDNKESAE